MQKHNKKMFAVHRVIGQYEIDGTITCMPAPRPGMETALVEFLIDTRVENLVKDRILADLFQTFL